MTDPLLEKLDQLQTTGANWKPTQVGDTLLGTFVRYRQLTSAHGACQVADLDTGSGVVTVWLRTKLRMLFDDHQPQPGDRVALRYRGMKQSKQERTFRDYALAVEKAQEPVDDLCESFEL